MTSSNRDAVDPHAVDLDTVDLDTVSTLTVADVTNQASPEAIHTDRAGRALQGHDPVAYFTEAKAVKGDKTFSTKYKESVFHFSSAKNRDAFVADPEKYAPQYSGYCAYGVAQGAKAKIEGKNFTVRDGKLYLNYNDSVQATWLKDTDGYIATANKKWPELK